MRIYRVHGEQTSLLCSYHHKPWALYLWVSNIECQSFRMLPKFICLCLIKPRTLEVMPEATEVWPGFCSILNFHYISII